MAIVTTGGGSSYALRTLLCRKGERISIGHRDPRALAAGYDIGRHDETLDRMPSLLDQLTSEAAR